MDSGSENYRRFLEGDDNGIAEIVSEYKDGLILFIKSFVNDYYIAEELTEETFFRLLIKKPKFAGKSSFKSWLFAIGRYTAVDYLRHNNKILYTSPDVIKSYALEGETLEMSYIKKNGMKALLDAVDRLPDDYRRIIWLVFFEDFSNEEASVAMNKSGRQIRNLLYRAKQALKNELERAGLIYEDF